MAKNAVPNIFTFSNLACGVLSILMTFEASSQNVEAYKWACLFILLAALIDRYDGRVARFLNVSSEIGKELDSLADLVSFGVAPSILAYNLYDFSKFGPIGYVLVLVFPIAGAYRLARFNTTTFDGNFTGIPITAAGVILAFYSLIILLMNSTPNIAITVVFIIMLAYLMVCNLKFKKV
ncbi:CDP-diacylglycerol--serine O-phosphatidyltransferase [Clostridium acidisoli DSM 12555]|jgi:CDP-diacylglycerol--serine O-phosphatidyltransferase|uniref:CDP-diacylglycerol--serine O-phosphatidyltransferase n=1 Tax=Clostridium acidisoli DSM 12555 TaxID=1121291 RepID=A0A1W1XIY9_9CLOT|nr:CDP-diacylglycerol--serine O-phosphatidyltransferase [Clostridium acidisoli]SMC23792.1 CDP-diacylglycerol--serine O-phosphatidyltransferase [Clostridium acidisoli DSM 12555]